ncbi:TPA: hypothetical protein ACWLUJ_006178 [Pseudomonas aeruginosa]|nr:hypothetical protein [Pseudomonas aeruginosa]EIU2863525.1 hypothetical protein [Pseudomonas aeruginosa]HEJ2342712.1 hypothetical protein [Pseudomonas aeruginosa]
MFQFDLSTVKQLRKGFSTNIDSVNAQIADGWVLISTADGEDASGAPLSVYTLGWAKDEEPKPESEY